MGEKHFKVSVMKKGTDVPTSFGVYAHSVSEARQKAKSMYPTAKVVSVIEG